MLHAFLSDGLMRTLAALFKPSSVKAEHETVVRCTFSPVQCQLSAKILHMAATSASTIGPWCVA